MRHPSTLTPTGVFLAASFFAAHIGAVQFLNSDWEDVELGQPFTLRWQGQGNEGVNLWLMRGPADNLREVETVATNVSATSLAVRLGLFPEGDDYAFRIQDIASGEMSYSPAFDLDPDDLDEEELALLSSALARSTSTTTNPPSSTAAGNQDNGSTGDGNTSDGLTTSPPASTPTGNEDGGTRTSSGEEGTGTPSPGSSSELSTGAKAGIGVGAGLGGILILLAVAWIFHRRRKSTATTGSQVGELEAAQAGKKAGPELTGNPVSELPGDEYGSSGRPSELPSPESPFAQGGGQHVMRSELP